ncbi:MAG TPA: hypothetical protein VGN47_11055 [Blastococcus sp.]|nr:hypothetical protein [Blastococcus sp.]
MRRTLGLLGSGLLAAAFLTACDHGPLFSRLQCLPAPLSAEPRTVAVGAAVTLTSGPFACDGSYPEGHRYRLQLLLLGRAQPIELGTAPVAVDGSFRATVVISPGASPGDAYVEVRGSPFDDCPDDGSCARYGVAVTLVPAAGAPATAAGR